MAYFRSKAFDFLLLLWTVLLGGLIPILAVMKSPRRVRAGSRLWSKGIVVLLRYVVGLRHTEVGAQNKVNGPALYVCNHQSMWETLVFNTLVPDIAIVLKSSLYKVPIFGWYLKNSPMIDVDRDDASTALRKMVKEAKEAVACGRSILIFPEGTRRGLHGRPGFKHGVAALYRALDIPVVPVAINAGMFWAAEGTMKRSGNITISYLEPLAPGLPPAEFLAAVERLVYDERDRLIAGLD